MQFPNILSLEGSCLVRNFCFQHPRCGKGCCSLLHNATQVHSARAPADLVTLTLKVIQLLTE